MTSKTKVSILMLTYNAPFYVLKSVLGVKLRTDCKDTVEYELVVVDNRSRLVTRVLVKLLKATRFISVLHMNPNNDLFAGGNNIAATLADSSADLFLLLNSDVRINNTQWLNNLVENHKRGVTSYGAVDSPTRADGYCYLIDADLYSKYPLDDNFQWWWSITKQQAKILSEASVQVYRYHEKWLHHYGGKSGKGYIDAKGMDVDIDEVKVWFEKGSSVVELK